MAKCMKYVFLGLRSKRALFLECNRERLFGISRLLVDIVGFDAHSVSNVCERHDFLYGSSRKQECWRRISGFPAPDFRVSGARFPGFRRRISGFPAPLQLNMWQEG